MEHLNAYNFEKEKKINKKIGLKLILFHLLA